VWCLVLDLVVQVFICGLGYIGFSLVFVNTSDNFLLLNRSQLKGETFGSSSFKSSLFLDAALQQHIA
jgi:hypothetical protein